MSSAQRFPIVENGKWGLVNAEGEIILQPTYAHLSEPDEYGYIVAQNTLGSFGVLDSLFKEKVSFTYSEINKVNGSLYSLRTKASASLHDVKLNKSVFDNYTQKTEADFWLTTKNSQKGSVYSFYYKNSFDLSIKERIVFEFDKLVLVTDGKNYRLIHAVYGPVEVGEANSLKFSSEVRKQEFGAYTFFSQGKKVLEFSQSFDEVKFISQNEYHCRSNDSSYIFNATDSTTRYVGNLKEIQQNTSWQPLDRSKMNDFYQIETDEGKGLMRRPNKILIRPEYDWFYTQGNYIILSKGEERGIMSRNFRMLVPAAFFNVYEKDGLFYAENEDGYKLYSKNGKVLINKEADRFEVNLPIIKAYSGKSLTHYIVENNKILGETTFTNTVQISRKEWSPRSIGASSIGGFSGNIDDSRDSLPGWYFEKFPYYTKDSVLKERTLWGIKNASDSVIQKPRFRTKYRVKGTQITAALAGKGRRPLTLYYTDTNRRLRLGSVLAFRDDWYENHKIAPIVTRRKMGFLDSTATLTAYDWIEVRKEKSRNLVVRNEGEKIAYKSEEDAPEGLPAVYIEGYEYGIPKDEKDENNRIVFETPKFNFIDSNGTVIFETWFDHAKPMILNRSIVKLNGKYGVVNQDSIIIPIEYLSIKEVYVRNEFSNEMFEAKLFYELTENHGVTHYYDKDLNKLEGRVNYPSKRNDFHNLYKVGRSVHIQNNKGETILSNLSNAKLYDDGKVSVKKKRKLTFYDKTGVELGTELPPAFTWFTDEVYLFKLKSKFGVITIYGDTVLRPIYKQIEYVNGFYKLSDGVRFYVLNDELQQLYRAKTNFQLLHSAGSVEFAIKSTELTFYNEEGKKKNKLPVIYKKEYSIRNGTTIWAKNDEELLVLSFLGDTISYFEFDKFQRISEDELAMRQNKISKLYSANLDLLYEHSSCKMVKITDSIYQISSARIKGVKLVNIYTKDTLMLRTFNGFSQGLAVVSVVPNKLFYIDKTLSRVNQFEYKTATPYKAGRAIVSTKEGYSLIDLNGRMLTYPNFSTITYCNDNTYATRGSYQKGLANFDGEIIIPTEYKKIEYRSNGIFAVTKNGELGYVKSNGEALFVPR